jgi:hypothetical protein
MSAAEDFDEEWTEAQDRAWCAEQRARVLEYLEVQGVLHGGLAREPAWHVGPFVAVWAVGSLKAPGRVGWWAISGDLPCDYCSSEGCPDPRSAIRTIAEAWRTHVELTGPGDEVIHDSASLPADLAPLLASRAQFLLEWVADDSFWATQH